MIQAAVVTPRPFPVQMDHLSWSSLSTYRQCPRKFAFRYVEFAPEERCSAALPFGGAVHAAFEALHQARLEGAALPVVDELIARYESAWTERASGGPELVFGKGEDATSLKDTAGRMLHAYRSHIERQAVGARVLAIEHAERFDLLPETPPVVARVDLIEVEGQALVVTDTKTSKARWSEAQLLEHRPQLVLYAYALVGMRRALGLRRILPRFEVITKGKRPAIQCLEPRVSREDAVRIRSDVSVTWAAIAARAFPRRESWACTACPYRHACLGR
ncbi:MAG: hypothetical protein AMXMBFR7_52640 [Planctomycetota bacterium]|nr:PD-(D/E)XK nuclease family protein [Planctomycetota bacterium]